MEPMWGMGPTKALLRSIAPVWVLRRRAYNYYAAMAERNRERQLAKIFTEIYARGAWNGGDRTQYVSGAGSLPENTKGYESFIADVICRDPKLETWVDIGCGDF